jgi:siroheme synthase
MGVGTRHELAETLIARGWNAATPAALVCGASTPEEWIWTGTVAELGANEPPAGVAGVVVIGDVVRVRERLVGAEEQKVMYGRNR